MENIYSAENALVGSMLIDPSCVGEIVHTVTADDFQQETARNIFAAVQSQYLSGLPLDPVTISANLTENEAQFLAECMRMTPTANNFGAYAELVKKSGMLHKFQKLGLQLADTTEIEQAEKVVSKLNSLSAATPQGTFQTAQEAANSFMDKVVEQMENGVEFINWGLYPLDVSLHTRRGDFIVIGARPSCGKSAFALQTALHMAAIGYRVGFCSLEMGTEAVTDRCIAHMSGVPLDKIARRNFSDEEFKHIQAACMAFYELPVGFDYSCRTVAQIQARALSERWDVVFVDYIQLMTVSGKSSRYETVTELSQGLQQLAHMNNILVVALSQLSRQQTTADGKQRLPGLTDLRESGQLEQDADAVILMSLEDINNKDSDRFIQLAKNRQGRCCNFLSTFDGDIQRFTYRKRESYE